MISLMSSIATSGMKGAVVPVGRAIISSSTGTVTFSNIPQIYQDLVIMINGITTSAARFNVNFGDSSSLYSDTWMITDCNATSFGGGRYTAQSANQYGGLINGSGTTQPSFAHVYIPNYTNTVTFKSHISRFGCHKNSGTAGSLPALELVCGVWRNTNAITTVNVGLAGLMTNGSVDLYAVRTVGQ